MKLSNFENKPNSNELSTPYTSAGLLLPERVNGKGESQLVLPNSLNKFLLLPKLGLDKDEVLFAHTGRDRVWGFRGYYGRNYNIWIGMEDMQDLNYGKVLNLAYDRYRADIRGFQRSVDYGEMLPNPGVPEAVRDLSGFCDLTVLTASPIFLKDAVEGRLDQVFKLKTFTGGIEYSANGHDGASGESKGKICEDLGIKMAVEDYIPYAMDMAKRRIKVFLYHQEWNKQLEGPYIERFYHMSQLPALVKAEIARMTLLAA